MRVMAGVIFGIIIPTVNVDKCPFISEKAQ